jgi:uncharacterized membrane protein (UPF0127 family)
MNKNKKKNNSHYFVHIFIVILGSALIILLLTFVFSKSNIERNVFAPGINISNHNTRNNNSSSSDHYYLKANVRINGFNLIADVPTTNEGFQKGLDIKDHLNENQGMLFIFKEPGKIPFWMHGMKFPIDIIWFDKDKNVVHIEHDLQPCITDLVCPSYSPEKDALYVLETTAGFYQRHNVKVGTHMDFILIR